MFLSYKFCLRVRRFIQNILLWRTTATRFTMGFFSNSSDDQNYTEEALEDSKSLRIANGPNPFNISIEDFNREITNTIDRAFDIPKIKSFWDEFKPLDRLESWSNFQKGRGAYGLKSYQTPTLTDYSNCVKNDGASVWDENGWWRCLFPRSVIKDSRELSKEDVEGDASNKYGLFFKDYNDLLSWKLNVRELVRKKEENDRKLLSEANNIQAIYDDYSKDVDFTTGDSDVVSTSKSVYFKTLDNGDGEEITETKKVFRDGRTESQKFKKLIPRDGGEPVIESLDSNNKDHKLLGWIWDEKSK